MAADVLADERALRHDRQAPSPGIVERSCGETTADSLPLERRVDFGVNEHDAAGLLEVGHEAGEATVDDRPVALLLEVLADGHGAGLSHGFAFRCDGRRAHDAHRRLGLVRTGPSPRCRQPDGPERLVPPPKGCPAPCPSTAGLAYPGVAIRAAARITRPAKRRGPLTDRRLVSRRIRT